MLKKGIITYILENYKDIQVLNELSDEEILFLKNKIEKIDMYKLYRYEFHGVFHSQKVMLFAYLIGKKKKLNSDDMKILLDAAVYHDMGRDSDFEETTHGYSSTLKYDNLFKNDEFYRNEENFSLLKAITESHCVDDAKKKRVFENYDIDDNCYERYNLLHDILRDADALDRARFPKTSKESIREEFLKLDFSKQLVDFSFIINSIYRNKIDQNNFEKYKNMFLVGDKEKCCLHGIGFDFSKLESILDSGILSGYAAKKNAVQVSRNFEGNNSDMWISVIDSMDVSKQGTAYKQFADNNISFFCNVNSYQIGEKNFGKAQSQGLPVDSGLYEDESFVFYEIPNEDIYAMILPSNSSQLKLSELNYLYCSANFKTIKGRVDNYCKYIENLTGIVVDRTIIDAYIRQLYEQEISFGLKSQEYQKANMETFFSEIDLIVSKINTELGKWVSFSFKSYLNLENMEPTVLMVVYDILKRKNIMYDVLGDETTEFVVRLIPKQKDDEFDNKITK